MCAMHWVNPYLVPRVPREISDGDQFVTNFISARCYLLLIAV